MIDELSLGHEEDSSNRKERAKNRTVWDELGEGKNVGRMLDDNIDIRMEVFDNNMNKVGETIKVFEMVVSFIKYNTIQ